MKCDLCHEREATVHQTHIVDEAVTHINLCGDCFEASAPTGALELQTALQTGCRYCGGKPYTGNSLSFGVNGPVGLSFMCKRCADEYFRFLRQKVPGFGDPDSTPEQLTEMASHDMASILTETDEHMRRWVAERGT